MKHVKLLVLSLTLLSVSNISCSVIAKSNFTVVQSRSRRVVGGHAAQIDQIPHLVSIRRKGVFECGGSLVTSRCVLTAAHCIRDGRANEFTVRAGATYLNEFNASNRRVSKIITKTKFNRRTFESDVAIFQLESEVRGPMIATIPISKKTPQVGDFIRIAGWGITHETHTKPSNQMRTAFLQVWPQTECQKLYADYRNVTNTMFCASIPGEQDACQADSGGPAMIDDQLVGIVSWGRGYECGRRNSPGVYTNITKLRLWINKVLEMYCI